MPTIERLKELQALPLARKIGFTAARIAEWYNHYDGKVHVSFSGGKDSTVLLYIVRNLFPEVPAMFVDTGLEYPEIREFVKTWDNVDIVKPDIPFNKVIKQYGFPVISKEIAHYVYYTRKGKGWSAAALGIIEDFVTRKGKHMALRRGGRYDASRWKFLVDAPFAISDKCCEVMKKKPAHKYAHEKKTFSMVATMTEESQLRTQIWMVNGCNAFGARNPVSAPMSFWTEQDVLHYIKQMNIPIASVYGDIVQTADRGGLTTTGAKRTGCMFCMFGAHLEKCPNRFQRMYFTHPKQWDYCINRLGLKQVLDYIHVPYEPEPDLFNYKTLNHNP